MKLIKMILAVYCCLLSGCASSYRLTPIVDQSQNIEMIYIDGREVAVSIGNNTLVALHGFKTAEDEIVLHILYMNNTQDRINIDPEKVSVAAMGQYGKSNLKTYSAEDYLRVARKKHAWALAFYSFGSAMETYNAGRSSTATRTTANIYSSDGYATGNATSISETYDHGKQVVANRESRKDIQAFSNKLDRSYSDTEMGLLKRNTLFPGQSIEGNVVIDYNTGYVLESAQRFVIEVPFEKELHRIEFKPAPK